MEKMAYEQTRFYELRGTVETTNSICNKLHLGSNSYLLGTLKWSESDHSGTLVKLLLYRSFREDKEKRAYETS